MKSVSTVAYCCFLLLGCGGLYSVSASAEEVKQPYQNITLNAKLALAEGKSFKDPIVLLTHGTLTHKGRSTYRNIQDALSENGMSSLAINLSLGVSDRQGEYDCTVPHTHKHTDAIGEIQAWVNWLKAKGANHIVLMGHSRGGNQTAWYASEQPDTNVKKVVLLAPATSTWTKHKPAKYQQAKELVSSGKGNTLLPNTDILYCENTKVSANTLVDYHQDNEKFDSPTLLKTAKLPTLVIMGSADTIVADLPTKMDKVSNPNVSTYMVEDAGHFFMDLFGEEAAEVTVEFINQ